MIDFPFETKPLKTYLNSIKRYTCIKLFCIRLLQILVRLLIIFSLFIFHVSQEIEKTGDYCKIRVLIFTN